MAKTSSLDSASFIIDLKRQIPVAFAHTFKRLLTIAVWRTTSVQMIILYFLIIANVWQRGLAESNSCSSSVTISNQSDANKLNSCDTFQGSITISPSASGVITINNVEEIKGAFTVEDVSELTEILAPDLETVQGAFTLSNLNSLTTITMGALSQVSSMKITGNQKLKDLAFQELEEVGGQLELRGSFDSVLLPSLNQVKGRTVIRGSSSMSCSALDKFKSDEVFKGGYSCSDNLSGLSPGAKGGIAVGVIFGVLLIVLILWFVLRRRRQRKRAAANQSTVQPSSNPSAVVAHEEKSSISTRSTSPQESISLPSEPQNLLPRKPVGSAIFLDSRSIHEAPNGSTPVQVYHELDAGPVWSSHQRPLHAD